MFIVYGTRVYFRTKNSKTWHRCEFCLKHAKHHSYNGSKFFHLYFLPLIPMSGRLRCHKVCSKCNRYRELKAAEVESLMNTFKENVAECVQALLEGESKADIGDQKDVECLPVIHELADEIASLGDNDFLASIVTHFSTPHLRFEQSVLVAKQYLLRGDRRNAIATYEQSCQLNPTSSLPVLQLAHLYEAEKRFGDAEMKLRRAIELNPEQELNYQLELIDNLTAQAKPVELVRAYERVFELAPNLANESFFKKGYAKATKKASKVKPQALA